MGDTMTIGERIKSARNKAGMTQKQLGIACGIDEANIRKYELGKQNPKYETVLKIASALNISVFDLLGYFQSLAWSAYEADTVANYSKHLELVVKSIAEKHNLPCSSEKAAHIVSNIYLKFFNSKLPDDLENSFKTDGSFEEFVIQELTTIDSGILALHIQSIFQDDMYFHCNIEEAEELAEELVKAVKDDKLDSFLKLYTEAEPRLRKAALMVLGADEDEKPQEK